MRVFWCCTMLALASFVGCTEDVGTSTSSDPPAGSGTAETGTPGEDTTSEGGSATRDDGSATRDEGSGTVANDPPAKPKRIKAGVGTGKQGRSLDEYDTGVQAVFAEPAKAFFAVRERIVQINIDKAMQFYKGAHGNAPKSHDEFMSQIIEANKIDLPPLPTGQKYAYDPQRGELMIEK